MGAFIAWNNDQNTWFFDVVTQETQTRAVQVTEHAVEQGANISDHVRPQLDEVSLEVYVSNSPLYALNGAKGRVDGVVLEVPKIPSPPIPTVSGLIDSGVGFIKSLLGFGPAQISAQVFHIPDGGDFVQKTISQLDQLRTEATLVSVICKTCRFDSMLLQSFEVKRSSTEGTGANISLSFKQIRTVKSFLTTAPIPAIPRAKPPAKVGVQAPIKDPAQRDSVLFFTGDKVGGPGFSNAMISAIGGPGKLF